jgi:hypothetical protein
MQAQSVSRFDFSEQEGLLIPAEIADAIRSSRVLTLDDAIGITIGIRDDVRQATLAARLGFVNPLIPLRMRYQPSARERRIALIFSSRGGLVAGEDVAREITSGFGARIGDLEAVSSLAEYLSETRECPPIAALGTAATIDGEDVVVYLTGDGKELSLRLSYVPAKANKLWGPNTRFLATIPMP